MRVLHIALHFSEYAVSAALSMAQRESSSVFLLIVSRPNFDDEIPSFLLNDLPDNLTLRFLRHDRRFPTIISNFFVIKSIFNEFKPDVIHCQEEPKDYLIFSLIFLRASRRILTVHDPRPHQGDSGRKNRFSRLALYVKVLRFWANSYIVHGESLALELTRWSERGKQITCVPIGPYGVLSRVARQPVPASGRLLFFGRMEVYKGLNIFVDAVKMLRREGFTVTGVLAGRGPALDALLGELRSDSSFEIINHFLTQEEVICQFDSCQLVVLPYLNATQSGVAAYALGRGRGMVASRVGALPEVVRDGFNGSLVEAGDLVGLVDALRKLLVASASCRHMGDNSWLLGKNELSWFINAELTIAAYRAPAVE